MWGLFEYIESGAEKLFDHPVLYTLLLSPFVTPQVQLRKQSFSSVCTNVLNFQELSDYTVTAVAQWLSCRVTNRKDAGSTPAGVGGFFIDINSFRLHCGPGVESASNKNEYQEYFLGVKAAGA